VESFLSFHSFISHFLLHLETRYLLFVYENTLPYLASHLLHIDISRELTFPNLIKDSKKQSRVDIFFPILPSKYWSGRSFFQFFSHFFLIFFCFCSWLSFNLKSLSNVIIVRWGWNICGSL
jgi:hypothetical protein